MDCTVTIRSRRGVLLLVVLSMLTLFLMLGATYLVAASRARRAARAFADNTNSIAQTTDGEALVDDAFRRLARGSGGGSSQIASGDDLLGDRYGLNTTSGTMSGSASGAIVIAVPATRMSDPASLAGRVITFTLPGLGTPSTRIIRAVDAANGTTLYVPGGPTASGDMLTAVRINAAKASAATNKPHFVINGRDFDDSGKNEPYDAVDSANPFLAKVVQGSATPSFSGAAEIDNDSDGTPDSGWIDVGLPSIVDSSGTVLSVKAAMLVVDLDGRLNVNTHGSASDVESPERAGAFAAGHNLYPDYVASGTIPLTKLPRGLGLGTAEIAIASTSLLGPTTGTSLPELLGGASSRQSVPADTTTGRPTPAIGNPEGRYGDAAWSVAGADLIALPKPGAAQADDNWAIDRWVSYSGTSGSVRYFEDVYTRYGSPPDLKGRMRVWVDENGQPVYYKPAWSQVSGRAFADDDVVDDPYEVDLGPKGSRTGYVATPANANATTTPRDNIYTVADAEGILRYYDPDAIKLSKRLVSICRNWTATARLHATTDSWDTPGVVGSFWKDVVASPFSSLLTSGTAATGSRPFDVFAPETVMGHKLDLNRPFHPALTWEPINEDLNGNGSLDPGEDINGNNSLDSTGLEARQQFAKHFYCLSVAIACKNKDSNLTPAEAEQLAQWAVNVVDFRDADSAMTPFDYDETFTTGSKQWAPTKRVWGCERPEVLITETIAWHDRRTEDRADDTNEKKTVKDKDPTAADNDFDQKRRPRGAFFVTLYSPWGSQAKRVDNLSNPQQVVDVTKSGTTTPAYRGEPLPRELTAQGVDRFSRTATISLGLRHDRTITESGTASPVWRLVSVRGDVQGTGTNGFGGDGFGKDPVRPSTANTTSGTLSILDPARPNATAATVGSGTAVIDRIFYFTAPPTAQANEKPGSVFWQSGTSTIDPSPTKFVVVGTDRLVPTSFTTLNATGSNASVHRTFDQPAYKPATLSEPTVTTDDVDAYQTLATANGNAQFGNTGTDLYAAGYTLNSTLDSPLDSMTTMPGGVSKQFLDDASKPLLMCNGTHPNFSIIHLQRLANPSQPWHSTNNPYLTVDSMTVDLTVVNTNGSETSVDEPGQTPTPTPPPATAWLASQNEYRTKSVQRGGKTNDRAAAEADIWNRRVNASSTDLTLDTLFRTGTIAPRPIDETYFTPAVPNESEAVIKGTPVTLTTTSGTLPERYTAKRFPWLLWPNRPYTTPAELASVPTTSSFHLLRLHSTGSNSTLTPAFAHLPGLFETSGTTPWTHLKGIVATGTATLKPGIFDFVHVPTRFGGSYVTLPINSTTTAVLEQHGLANQPYNHFSLFREPGRMNINTVYDDSVRNALFGTTSGTSPAWNTTALQSPRKSWLDALKAANDSYVDTFTDSYRNSSLDSYFRHQTAGRLANTVTTRSNVFAVWVTIGYFDGSTEVTPVRRHRGFFILDRSIPVGYQNGKDLNVEDAIVLRRIIE